MKILAFDVSSAYTGIALINNGKISIKHCGLIAPCKSKSHGERLVHFQEEVRKLIQFHKPDYTVIEDIFKGRNMNTFKLLSMFRGIALKTIYEETKKDPINMLAVTARSELGIGIKKEQAFEAIVTKYNLTFDFEEDNDTVDAIVLGLAAQQLIKQGRHDKPIRNTRTKKGRNSRRNKESIPEVSA